MKKTLYSLLAFATLLFAASCAKEPVNVADPADGGKPVATTFSVNLGGALTKAGDIQAKSAEMLSRRQRRLQEITKPVPPAFDK